jgi:hypothetical protein
MRYRVTDIETTLHPGVADWLEPCEPDPKLLEPIEPDSRLKDPVKVAANLADVERRRAARPAEIAASILERTAERNEKCSLDPDCCRIVALGYHDIGHADPTVYLMRDEFEEREQLKLFWASWKEIDRQAWHDGGNGAALVTFNGLRFDLPILMRRSMYLDVPHPVLNLDRYRTPHIDLWQRLSFNGAISAHSLSFYGKRLGMGTLDKVHGSDIAQLVREERWQEIHDHCLSDIGLTHALANRLGLLKLAGVAA